MLWRRFTIRRRAPQRIRRRPVLEPLESRCLLAVIAMLDTEQLAIELINRARANPTAEAARLGIDLNDDLLPGTLSATSKQPLAPHQILIDVAAAHSQDMLDRDFFAHINPDGDGPGQRIAAAQYDARSWAENLALDADVVRAHDLLFQSAGHRINMLRDSFREIGVGIRDDGGWGLTVTEVFASRAGDAFLTGVAFSDHLVADNFFSPGEGLSGVTIVAAGKNRGTVYTTTTGPTGGYALQVPPDTYNLTAAGGELANFIGIANIVVGTQNVKVDFVVPDNEPGGPAPPVARDDRAMTEKDAAAVIEVLANDSGGFPWNLATVTIVSPPSGGQAIADPATGRVTYTPVAAWTGPDEFTYQVQDGAGFWSSPARVFVAVIDLNDRPWQNPRNALDVNADGIVGPLDVLVIVNDLNVHRARSLPMPSPQGTFPSAYLDVNGDGQASPQDVMIVVNWFNAFAAGEGEASVEDAYREAIGRSATASQFVAAPQDVPRISPPQVDESTGRGRGTLSVERSARWIPFWLPETSHDDLARAESVWTMGRMPRPRQGR